MSKKYWLLLILIVIVVGWLIASKYFEGVDPWIGEHVGGPIWSGLGSTKNNILATPFWQTWIGPYTYIYTFVGGLFVMFFGYRWATKGEVKLPFQNKKATVPDVMDTVVPQQTYVAPKQPAAVVEPPAQPATTPAETEKKEEQPVVVA